MYVITLVDLKLELLHLTAMTFDNYINVLSVSLFVKLEFTIIHTLWGFVKIQ